MLTINSEPIIAAPSAKDLHPPENASQPASTSQQGFHEAAKVVDYAAPQETPKEDEHMDLRQIESAPESSTHEAAKVVHNAAGQETATEDKQM